MNTIQMQQDRIKQVIGLIDLTNLDDQCDSAAIEQLCTSASTPLGNVAAVCVWPKFVSVAKQHLEAESLINIATVINFPNGTDTPLACTELIGSAIEDGANEIDYVLPYKQLLAGNNADVVLALQSVRASVPSEVHLKVILETGELKAGGYIKTAAEMAIDQGADFIKTSTGKVATNATPEAAGIMLDAIAEKNKSVGFKPAGGIRTVNDAEIYLKLAENRLGKSWVNTEHFRFGASGLLQDALAL